jgi:hypothetical protein
MRQRLLQQIHINNYVVENMELQEIISQNRSFLSSVDTFLTKSQYEEVDYGIPKNLFAHLDSQINNYPTYTDLLIFMTKYLERSKINYLEIGVSVMKNYLQIANSISNSNIVGFDNNMINPNFREIFNKHNEQLYLGKYMDNELLYFYGDLLDVSDTDKFKELEFKFDLIFSDALHTKIGVEAEYNNIIKDSLSDKFILYFDDLDFPELYDCALNIYKDLSKDYNHLYFCTFDINGWVGQHEKFHTNGFISTIDFKVIFKKEKIFLKNFIQI